jgi:hypothetical protein
MGLIYPWCCYDHSIIAVLTHGFNVLSLSPLESFSFSYILLVAFSRYTKHQAPSCTYSVSVTNNTIGMDSGKSLSCLLPFQAGLTNINNSGTLRLYKSVTARLGFKKPRNHTCRHAFMGGILYTLHFMNYIQDWTHNECYLRYALFALLSLDSRPRIQKEAQ